MTLDPEDTQPPEDWTAQFPVEQNAEALAALRALPACEHGAECVLADPRQRAYSIALAMLQGVNVLSNCAEVMFQHGDELAAEQVISALGRLVDECFYPYFLGAGLPVDRGGAE